MASDVAELTQARFGLVLDGAEGAGDPAVERILARRTHRSYAPRPVAEGLLRTLVATALSASSKSDYQQASILLVNDAAKRQSIAQLFPAMPWIGEAPVFLVFCADARRLRRVGGAARPPVRQRQPRGVLQCQRRCGAGAADLHSRGRGVRAGLLPDQRHPQPPRRGLSLAGAAARRDPGGRPMRGLPVGTRSCQPAPAAGGDLARRPLRRLQPARRRSTPTTGGATPAMRSRRRSSAAGRRRSARRAFYGWSEDKARQLAEGEGSGFGAFVRGHGFTLRLKRRFFHRCRRKSEQSTSSHCSPLRHSPRLPARKRRQRNAFGAGTSLALIPSKHAPVYYGVLRCAPIVL